MTKNESKLLSLQGIAKASAFCLLLSAFSVNAAMAAPAGTVDEVMAVQQGKKVTGVVIDGTGEPVIGANVVVKGTTNGTITDFDGNYTIEGVSANDVLVISYIGYLSQEVPVGNQSMIKVTLKEDTQTLDEVVVVGYGTMKKSDVTGSISTAKGDDLVKNQSFSALDNLRGKVSGVNIFSNSSQPGAYSNRVVIRGIATINSSSNPLYVVDGVVMENFDLVNPNDIESMEVLKDASAAAIYGARGANGVIMVTTKRGKKDGEGVAISYQGSVSVSSIARKMDLLNAQEWTDTFMKGLENENKWLGTNWSLNRTDWFTDRNYFDANGNPIYDTDWQDEATRTAVSHNHQLNIQQAGKNSSMGAFLNYTDQQGIMLNTYNKRLNAKMAYDADPTKWLSTSVNVLVNHTWGRYTPEDGGGQEARRTMIEMLPWLPVYEPGTNKYTTSTSPSLSGFNLEGMSNPVFILNDQRRMKYNTQIFGNAALTFHLAEGLDLKTQFGLDSHNITYRGYSSVGLNNISMPNGWAEYENWNTLYWQEETYLTYNKVLGDHRINAMAGLSWQERTYRRNKSKTEGFSDDFYEDYNMIVGTTPKSPESDWTRWAMNSYFLRLAYSYDNKYMATVTGRYDGSSKFGQNNKYAFFPSVGLGWMISNEDFLKDNSLISKLKLHTSYGLTGNSEIGTYKSLATVSQSNTIIGDALHVVSYLDNMPNPDLKWEKTGQWDLGFELGLFNNRLNFDISYYYKYTSDLLLDRPVPESTGYSSIMDNIGAVSNRGVDILVTAYPIQTHDFQWTSTLNLGFNKNRVEKLDESASVDPVTGKRQITTDGFVGYDMLIREGEELSSFYGYKRAGIYDGIPSNWDPETMNIPSTIGEKVTYKKREIIGNGLPDWMGSFINTFNYKGFDLTLDFQFTWGVDVMQEYYHSTVARFLTNGIDRLYKEAWHPTLNPSGKEQAIRLNNFGQGANNQADDDWVCNGSYLRCNMIQLGYTFNPTLIKKIGLSSLRLYANVNNAFLITSKDYNGYDPDNSSRLGDNKWGANRQFFTYPRPRTFTFGLNVAF